VVFYAGLAEAYNAGFDLDLYPSTLGDIDTVSGRYNVSAMPTAEPVRDQHHLPGRKDPYVVVPRYRDHLPPVCNTAEFEIALRTYFPPQVYATNDHAISQYLRLRAWTWDIVSAAAA
jgi:hypothetical protein